MSAAQQKHSHDSGFWKTFLRAVAANLEHALILFTWDASCKACCSMWIFLCVSPAKNVHSAAAGGLEWIWERVQKMVGGCVAWVKGSGWKSLSDEGIQRKDDASACPGQSQDGGREGGREHLFPQGASRCWPRFVVLRWWGFRSTDCAGSSSAGNGWCSMNLPSHPFQSAEPTTWKSLKLDGWIGNCFPLLPLFLSVVNTTLWKSWAVGSGHKVSCVIEASPAGSRWLYQVTPRDPTWITKISGFVVVWMWCQVPQDIHTRAELTAGASTCLQTASVRVYPFHLHPNYLLCD